jgi:hypothetical protein
VAVPDYIKVGDAVEGADLVRALGRNGLAAALVRAGSEWEVEISSPREDLRTFLADIGVVLAAWCGGESRDGAAARARRLAA